MEGNALQTLGWRTPDHDEFLATLDRDMAPSDYIELLDQIALAYKELTDAMAAAPCARSAAREYNVISALVALFRWLFFGQPSPRSISNALSDHSLAAQSRLSKAEEQLGSLVAYRLRPPCTLFDKDSHQLVLPPLTRRTQRSS
jgi:hypothetical protein